MWTKFTYPFTLDPSSTTIFHCICTFTFNFRFLNRSKDEQKRIDLQLCCKRKCCFSRTCNLLRKFFLVVADESMGRSVPFVFLERLKDEFMQLYDDDSDDDRFSIAYNLDREFGLRIKEQMDYCLNHPDEMSKLSTLKAQISEVKGIMMDNIEKVLDRGEKIELLVDKTENLQFQADTFHVQGRQLRRKMWLQNAHMKLMIGGAVFTLIIIVWQIICGAFQC
ncbi:hypothetical protein QVD17_07864 [Tagetes erecta]|uniref:Vesicle-associated membrane protein 727 n=1 Tax=Tagetes erecta TaxID=13708 RepID=A0AAD8KXE3_TARER|nr:hypothetical protein QVD17_07864 [Tagetes erecta]